MIFEGISKLHSRSQNKNVHCERYGFKFSCIRFKTFKALADKNDAMALYLRCITLCRVGW